MIFAYDRAIAHELLHSVGVEHHGGGDYKMDLFYIARNHPENRLGKSYCAKSLRSKEPIRVLDESGRDLAADESITTTIRLFRDAQFSTYLDSARQQYANETSVGGKSRYASPEALAEINYYDQMALTWGNHAAYIGVEHGEHSGNHDCLMRYYFAKYYEGKDSGGKTLYLVTSGSEPIGLEICRDGKGTGVNAAGHRPQSRYGNADGGAGNCFEQICPNDAIQPRKVKW